MAASPSPRLARDVRSLAHDYRTKIKKTKRALIKTRVETGTGRSGRRKTGRPDDRTRNPSRLRAELRRPRTIRTGTERGTGGPRRPPPRRPSRTVGSETESKVRNDHRVGGYESYALRSRYLRRKDNSAVEISNGRLTGSGSN